MKAISKLVLVAVSAVFLAGCGTVFGSFDGWLAKRSPLHQAAYYGNSTEVERLIKNGANVNAVARGWRAVTPLYLAAMTNSFNAAEVLIANGANVNGNNALGSTPLHWAAHWNSARVADLLIANGANLNAIETYQKQTPLGVAKREGSSAVASLLKQHGAEVETKKKSGNWLSKAARLGVGAVGLAAGGEVLKAGDEQLAQDIVAVSVQIAAGKEPEDIKTFSELASSTSSTVASAGGAGGLCERESNKANRQMEKHQAESEQQGIKPKHCAALKIFILTMWFNNQCAQDPSLTPARRQQSEAQYKVARGYAKQTYDGVNQMVADGTIQTDCDLADVAWTGMARNL